MNKNSVLRFMLTPLFIVSVLVATFLPTTSAFAAPSCTGTGCNGKDPYTMKCAGSGASYGVVATRKVYYGTKEVGYVQLWWSYTCKTNWARTVVWSPATYGYVLAQVVSGNKSYQAEYSNNKSEVHTAMVYAPTTLSKACGYIAHPGEGTDYIDCTVWK